MAKYFNESDIDEFHDCFFLFARDKGVTSTEELTIIMRSLGFSPTSTEIAGYFHEFKKDGKVDFASFLELMHQHAQKEKCQQEIVAAFQAHDRSGNGTVPTSELHHILCKFGEKLSSAEVDRLFQEAGIQAKGSVRYEDILRVLLTPIPDY
ncbi:hypothetical protein CAPTEDRAFT_20883 [Capitella teleta]|uniref:EF-hand domain-containing protein n=1 Tax=Capitella teleta TaxID=283909 RepID=R7VI97_CAPTE|nr:hypothetical protein CAPTEDRAFT_20883 [Capitella teleta]|eukprot:ELU18257.1 hypothetical protein CAPTEDRAFT_20883 [Capitella teleta]